MPFLLNPDDSNGRTINFFIRRYYKNAPTAKALFMFQGGPGFSSGLFFGAAQFWNELDASVTVYLADVRGVGLTAPLNCSAPPTSAFFDPYNATEVAIYTACNAEVAASLGTDAIFYSTHYASLDFVAFAQALKASGTEKLSLYCLSYGTYFCQTYLFNGGWADAVVLDGPVPVDRWRLEESGAYNGVVAGDNLRVCGQASAACQMHLGALGHIPRLVMDAIVDGSLPCLKNLTWLTHQRAANLNGGFMYGGDMTDGGGFILQPAFWWRLYRCSDSDVQQLTAFNNYKLATAGTSSATFFSYSLGMLVAANELYSSAAAPLTYAQQLNFSARLFADQGPLAIALAREPGNGARYTPNATSYGKYPNISAPILITVGTLDTNTPHGFGVWLRKNLGSNANLVTLPNMGHGTLGPGRDCANAVISSFLLAFGAVAVPDLSCVPNIPLQDYDGLTPAAVNISLANFGTDNLWNDNPRILPSPSPSPPTPPALERPAGLVAAVAVLGLSTFALAALLLFVVWRGRRTRKASSLTIAMHSVNESPAEWAAKSP